AKKATAKKAATKKATAKKATAKKAAKRAREKAGTQATTQEGRAALPDPGTVERPWLDSYPPDVPATYDYPLVPLTRLLDDAAQDFPQNVAVEFLGTTLTYRELLDQVDRFATALRALGVEKGDRVGIVLPNCPQHVIAIFAALRLGAIVAETNPLYTQAELEHQLNDAGCKIVVCLDPVYKRLTDLKGRLPTVEHVIATGIQDALSFPKNRLFALKGKKDGTYYKIPDSEGVKRFTTLVERASPAVPQTPVDARDDVAMLLYTGGTTGTSKGVMLTHFNLVANAFQARLWMPDVQAGRENVLCVMPFFHSYGLTTCLTFGLLSAATLTLVPRFDVDMVLKTIDKHKPTLFPGVPTIYVALNNAPDVDKHDLSSIRACLSGAAPLPVEVAKQFEELTGGKLREGYGLTETSPITHANPIYGQAKKGRIGVPITDTVATLVDVEDRTRPAPPGGPGELAVHGPQVMKGYWNRPEETAEVLVDGWLLTGDVAEVDSDGYFAIVDRKKDMIIAGGYNIYPRDIEEVLYTHPKVRRAVVAGIPDAYRGETVKAYIVLHDAQSATEEEIDAFLRDKLATYKVPKAYEFRTELPETMVGKVLRRELIEEEQAQSSQAV
ncbi:MAG TPA: long-chain fatty acid--CoA ligase, partial [Egibacteraceae bacterium]|nr:long-chain fatty acid--CoA ligase [Egibacteraceae bacterium]